MNQISIQDSSLDLKFETIQDLSSILNGVFSDTKIAKNRIAWLEQLPQSDSGVWTDCGSQGCCQGDSSQSS